LTFLKYSLRRLFNHFVVKNLETFRINPWHAVQLVAM
jgi:hypothetical protein